MPRKTLTAMLRSFATDFVWTDDGIRIEHREARVPAGIVRGILLSASALVLSSCSSMDKQPQAPYGRIFAGVQQPAAPVEEEEKPPEPEPDRTVYE